MASGRAAAALKMATVAACVLLVLLHSAPPPVMGATPVVDCSNACRDPCFSFADGFCGTGGAASSNPSAAALACRDVAFQLCDAACVAGCDNGKVVPCI
ncbi:hypothetical protein BAE44_0000706 [Dichanthelium oligosanthes]|uniref:Acidic protein n=1 Tax=Dichanthelium oligosanthes TaxID=888268 RepID=A0A1E5WLH9_9POAL|nr:hypothetical protein BAE44_0000706 [Dichanthelium oligosanthes]